ncbi:MAG TPA: glycosyltransferase [Acidimicrobiales bacterium]|nr:glycosyltransferase [Acidimicrobiales bacterium]
MRVVVDAVPVRASSLAVVVENLLRGWAEGFPDDELHVVLGDTTELDVPGHLTLHRVNPTSPSLLGRLRAQNWLIPGLCRELGADALVGSIPATTVAPLPCPRVVLALDLRYALRPEQFAPGARWQRRISYAVGYRQAGAIDCISMRTRDDLLRAIPHLASKRVRVALLGADHVRRWPTRVPGRPYAVAFGQWANKNVALVVDAWRALADRGPVMPLVIFGIPDGERARLQAAVDGAGLSQRVELRSWMSPAGFQQAFASASLLVFPSDFEGFGLPAVEAMALGIPVVVSPDPALVEVTGGHASVMAGWDAAALAEAVTDALGRSDKDRVAATAHAATFTWAGTAASVRASIDECRAAAR